MVCGQLHLFFRHHLATHLLDSLNFEYLQDHAGHIFGVDSSPMINKLEQYNSVLEVNYCLLPFNHLIKAATKINHIISLAYSLSFSCKKLLVCYM